MMSIRYEQGDAALEKAIDDMYRKEQELCTHLHGTFELIPRVTQCKRCSKVLRHRTTE